jgi:hypothetical protein
MLKFIKLLQLVLAIVVLGIVGYDVVLHGLSIFNENPKYVILSGSLWLLLELALLVIYKLVEDD